MNILECCRELLEICRIKCGPADEVILPSGRTNEQAMRDAMAAIEQFEDLFRALDEADTAFSTINLCDGLTPQARGCIRLAWPKIQVELARIRGPESAFTHAVASVRDFATGLISREDIAENLNSELTELEFAADDPRLTDAVCTAYALELGQILQIDFDRYDGDGILTLHRKWLELLEIEAAGEAL